MNRFIRKFFLSIVLSVSLSAATGAESTKMFDVIDVNPGGVTIDQNEVNESKFIGNDNLPQDEIDNGLHYTVDFGSKNEEMEVYIDPNTGERFYKKKGYDINDSRAFEDLNLSKYPRKDSDSKNYREEYEKYSLENIKNFQSNPSRTPQDYRNMSDEDRQMKKKRNQILNKNDNSFVNWRERFLTKESPTGKAMGMVNKFKKNINRKSAPLEMRELEDNATNYYNDTISAFDFEKQNTNYLQAHNVGVISQIYNKMDEIKRSVTERIRGTSIKCQISRGLVPSYQCPLPGKDNILFPVTQSGQRLTDVNLELAKKECEKICVSDPNPGLCKEEQFVDNTDWDLLSSEKTLDESLSYPLVFEKSGLDKRVLSESVELVFEVIPPRDEDMPFHEFEEMLSEYPIKVNIGVYGSLQQDDSLAQSGVSVPADSYFSIANKEVVTINSVATSFIVPVGQTLASLRVLVYKPYMLLPLQRHAGLQKAEKKYKELGVKVKLKKIIGHYASKGVYYCIPLQTADSPIECGGDKYKEITYGSQQHRFLCLDSKHKIGPGYQGGFYTQESCTRRCVVAKECVPTYRGYSTSDYQQSSWFKAEIKCVDDPTNKDCSEEICRQMIVNDYNAELNGDFSKRPINEQVVYNDDRVVYTIKNGTLTNEVRPKIDLQRELSTLTADDMEVIKINEEKDIALVNMIERGTYNRSKYKIGEHSPMNLAYIKADNGDGRTSIGILLKPDSYDFNNHDYYVYVVMRLQHTYRPKYGTWYVNGHLVDARDTPIVFKDFVYSVKDASGKWVPFRRDLFREVFREVTNYAVEQQSDTGDSPGGESGVYSSGEPASVSVQKDYVWSKTPQYVSIKFQIYNPSNNSWSSYDRMVWKPPYYKIMKFNKSASYYMIPASDYVEKDIVETPGLLIRDQIPIEHETDIRRIYNGDYNGYYKSNTFNYSFYVVYSPYKLTADELMRKIEGDDYMNIENAKEPWDVVYGGFDYLNAQKFRSGEVAHDGEINNNVKMFIMGPPNDTSLSVHITPSPYERGKRLYKFTFLYDEAP